MMTKLDLRDTTLCVADSANIELSVRALKMCTARCAFADAVLFSHQRADSSFRSVQIAPLNSRDDYSAFMLRELPDHIDTAYALVVQWDGYVIDADAWMPEFRDYDYIGARWDWFDDGMSVGNGGFSLRSQKLLRALRDPRVKLLPGINEDELICRTHRALLENEHGIRFAPENIADQFSYERALPLAPTFGFHGLFNMWRHTGDAEMVGIIERLHPYLVDHIDFVQTLAQYFLLRKFAPLRALYAHLRARFDVAEISERLTQVLPAEELSRCIQSCERLISHPAASPAVQSRLFDLPADQTSPGRNDPCPCGSGKKYKHCHGQLV